VVVASDRVDPAGPGPFPGSGSYPATLALALLAFHRHVGPIFKGTEAKYGKFADLRTVLEAVTPPLLDQGLVLTQTLEQCPSGLAPGSPLGQASAPVPGQVFGQGLSQGLGDAGANPFGVRAAAVASTAAAEPGFCAGSSQLRTQLLHAPSGESLCSVVALPNLNGLLGRVHELRVLALQQFPLDLQLAALGTVSTQITARPACPGDAPMGPSPLGQAGAPGPQRQPGLRLEEQIRGLQTTLQGLGTTSNPLHAIGAAITYLRRYQILALLSLAAEDNDAQEYGQRQIDPLPPPQGAGEVLVGRPLRAIASSGQGRVALSPPTSAGVTTPAAALVTAPMATPTAASIRQPAPRGRRPHRQPAVSDSLQGGAAGVAPVAPASRSEPGEARAHPAPAPPNPTPAVERDGVAHGTDQGQSLAQPPSPTEEPLQAGRAPIPFEAAELSGEAVQELISEIRTLAPTAIPQLVEAFRQQFQLPPDALVSDYIRTSGHAAFIRQQIASYGNGLGATHGGSAGNGRGKGAGNG